MNKLVLYARSEYLKQPLDTETDTIKTNGLLAYIMKPVVSSVMSQVTFVVYSINDAISSDKKDDNNKYTELLVPILNKKINDVMLAYVQKYNYILGGKNQLVFTVESSKPVNEEFASIGLLNYKLSALIDSSPIELITFVCGTEEDYNSDEFAICSFEYMSDINKEDIVSCCYPNLDAETMYYLTIDNTVNKYFKSAIGESHIKVLSEEDSKILKDSSYMAMKIIVFYILAHMKLGERNPISIFTICNRFISYIANNYEDKIQGIKDMTGEVLDDIVTDGNNVNFAKLYNYILE